ncbi:hypothetical protein J0910_06350 [Nocardiopsis sp. CNT-189]|uniref:divisome protein SepX/GlpR n=1 Tax=Nocardiopsis oceanisediminis TaxID=2816862 RepID=UPI003B2B2E34
MNSSALYLAIVVVWLVVLVPMLLRRDAADPDPAALDRSDPRAADPGPDEDGEEDGDARAEGYPGGADDADYDEYLPGPGADGGGGPAPAYRDGAGREPAAGGDGFDPFDPFTDPGEDPDGPLEEEPCPRPAAPSVSRARVIARRRRRTSGLGGLLAATAVAVALDLGPWWVLVPPVLLFGGHLVLLREAAKADAERRAALEEQRRAELRRARREEAARRAEEERGADVVDLPAPRGQEVYDQYTDAHQRAVGD